MVVLADDAFGTAVSLAVAVPLAVAASPEEEEDDEPDSVGWFDCRWVVPAALLLLLPLVLAPGSGAPGWWSVPKAVAGADVGVPRSGMSNGLVEGFALSSDRIGRKGRPPFVVVLGAPALSAASRERVFW